MFWRRITWCTGTTGSRENSALRGKFSNVILIIIFDHFFHSPLLYCLLFSSRHTTLTSEHYGWAADREREREIEIGETRRKKNDEGNEKGMERERKRFLLPPLCSGRSRRKFFFSNGTRERNTYKYMAKSRGGRVERGEIRLPE